MSMAQMKHTKFPIKNTVMRIHFHFWLQFRDSEWKYAYINITDTTLMQSYMVYVQMTAQIQQVPA